MCGRSFVNYSKTLSSLLSSLAIVCAVDQTISMEKENTYGKFVVESDGEITAQGTILGYDSQNLLNLLHMLEKSTDSNKSGAAGAALKVYHDQPGAALAKTKAAFAMYNDTLLKLNRRSIPMTGKVGVAQEKYSEAELEQAKHDQLVEIYSDIMHKHGLTVPKDAILDRESLKKKIMDLQGSGTGHGLGHGLGGGMPMPKPLSEEELEEKGKSELIKIYLHLVSLTNTVVSPGYESMKPFKLVMEILDLQKKLASSSGGGGGGSPSSSHTNTNSSTNTKSGARNLQHEYEEIMKKLNSATDLKEIDNLNIKLEKLMLEMEALGIEVGETEEQAKLRREEEEGLKKKAKLEKAEHEEKIRKEKEEYNHQSKGMYETFDKTGTHSPNSTEFYLIMSDDDLIAFMAKADRSPKLASVGENEKDKNILRIWHYKLDTLKDKVDNKINQLNSQKSNAEARNLKLSYEGAYTGINQNKTVAPTHVATLAVTATDEDREAFEKYKEYVKNSEAQYHNTGIPGKFALGGALGMYLHRSLKTDGVIDRKFNFTTIDKNDIMDGSTLGDATLLELQALKLFLSKNILSGNAMALKEFVSKIDALILEHKKDPSYADKMKAGNKRRKEDQDKIVGVMKGHITPSKSHATSITPSMGHSTTPDHTPTTAASSTAGSSATAGHTTTSPGMVNGGDLKNQLMSDTNVATALGDKATEIIDEIVKEHESGKELKTIMLAINKKYSLGLKNSGIVTKAFDTLVKKPEVEEKKPVKTHTPTKAPEGQMEILAMGKEIEELSPTKNYSQMKISKIAQNLQKKGKKLGGFSIADIEQAESEILNTTPTKK